MLQSTEDSRFLHRAPCIWTTIEAWCIRRWASKWGAREWWDVGTSKCSGTLQLAKWWLKDKCTDKVSSRLYIASTFIILLSSAVRSISYRFPIVSNFGYTQASQSYDLIAYNMGFAGTVVIVWLCIPWFSGWFALVWLCIPEMAMMISDFRQRWRGCNETLSKKLRFCGCLHVPINTLVICSHFEADQSLTRAGLVPINDKLYGFRLSVQCL